MYCDDTDDQPAPGRLEPVEADWLQIVRLICSSYDRDKAAGFDAAMALAERRYGSEHGPTLAARIAALVRALRVERRRVFNYISPACPHCAVGITDDEFRLLDVMRAGRIGDGRALESAVSEVTGAGQAPLLTAAAHRFGACAGVAPTGAGRTLRGKHLH